jgi:hypothetical protein
MSLVTSFKENTHISTVVVQFTSVITLWDVDLGKVTGSRDLHVFGGLDPVDTSESTSWHDTSSVVAVCAVGNRDTFRVSDGITSRRSPQAKVINRVEPYQMIEYGLGEDGKKRLTKGLAVGIRGGASSTVVNT